MSTVAEKESPTGTDGNTFIANAKPIEHAQRAHQSFPGANYVLPSDPTERDRYVLAHTGVRLALQHKLLKGAFEDRLIICPVAICAEDCILDSGTGSGTWLVDILSIVPTSTVVHAIDIEARLFPTEVKEVVSRGNVEFMVATITKLPPEWSDMFKLIHQRLLVAALRAEEWTIAIKEMMRTLAPGGWVQLDEVGSWKAGPTTEKHILLVQDLFKAKSLVLDCARYIPDMLRDLGFVNICVEERTIPLGSWAGDVGVAARDNFMGVFRGMKTPILNAGGLGVVGSEAEFDELLDSVENEWNETVGAEIRFYIFSAQKPDNKE
ncbi:uncharacterized protein B0H18DRAFT_869763 [Fomitopsis serialis]|uniref:uncharacterized protein n=1 Tax=Fomitopsis serialis TaxID=139415 RepID=UPI002007348B|nr:uncharacterized protein B0H18DRAFT_869763 [Neoantrodia serialis]KAH9934317.1 hypothetical protein B0H18DRAFT_869763 [Neoantrodia serialis]